MLTTTPHLNPADDVLSVSQLNQRARHLLEDVFPRIWVEGELSNLARPASGHLYFTLKDSQAQIRCAFFRQHAARVRHRFDNGTLVKVAGRLSIYEGRGDYQLIIERLEPAGDGALRAAFEALKNALLQEGLFAAERKQLLPRFPERIAIVTSPSGAVIRDIISVFSRRAPHIQLTLVPTAVQGREATAQIIQALRMADQGHYDAIILARGGGSIEDLWCFNEEAVARCIAQCRLPIISAIGHETDTTIADFVADVRAPTPTAAAELLAPERQVLLDSIHHLQQRMVRQLQARLVQGQLQFNSLTRQMRHPNERIQQSMQRLDELHLRLQRSLIRQQQQQEERLAQLQQRFLRVQWQSWLAQQQRQLQQALLQLHQAMQEHVKSHRSRLQLLMQTLHVVSPLATLDRGYSILQDEHNAVIHSTQQVSPKQTLYARLADGTLEVTVRALRPNKDNHDSGQ